ncbi:putative exocyst complex protein exo70 [Phaeomoniella chlamydospora]|uniref:Exocyst complex protein EXO70 n=1 Tax=Phaeomoniella chlamydospora TaxID=158046 RepID=A0A0G2H459_PHACM|nr:putative exocyst complex protein exo70 [Phaeomoniella chlamydospora]
MAVQEEEAEVEVLYANLGKLKTLTKKIQGSMARLDASGQVVKEAIGPIYSNTQMLQVTGSNVERINEAIERMRQPLDAKGREEGIIRAGPRSAGMPQYLGALKRVERALAELNSTNMRSNQQAVTEFSSLLAIGSKQLEDTFRSILQEDVRTVEPLHYITKDLPFPPIPPEKVPQLNQIASAMLSAASSSSRYASQTESRPALIFAEVRGSYVTASLQNLSTASINTSKRPTQTPGVYKEGTSGIGTYAKGIEGMFLAESENISKIFPPDERLSVLEMTGRGAMSEFARTLRELDNFIKANIMSDCFLAFEIIDLIAPLSYRLEQKTGGLRSGFSDALRPIRETAKTSVPQLLEETRRRTNNITILPNDGAPIPVVAETMARLTALGKYSQPLSSILSSIGDGNWRNSTRNAATSPTLDVSPDSFTLLANYFLDIISDLFNALESRAKTFHRSKPLQGCFLANCMSIIERSIRSSPDLARYLSAPPHSEKLAGFRKKGSTIYVDVWRDASRTLFDVVYTNRANAPGTRTSGSGSQESAAIVKSLPSKEKDNIKLKFKTFNTQFEELIARHKSLYMERDVRAALAKDVQVVIEPMYGRFWDKYHEIDKKGKTVKYTKGELSQALAGLA